MLPPALMQNEQDLPVEMLNSAASGRIYKAFGLIVSMPLDCPELAAASSHPVIDDPDVIVSFGDVPAELPKPKARGACYQTMPGQLLLQVDRVARFLVRNGNEITIDRHSEASDDCVRLFLLGSAFGALLQQRGNLVLHGSTIQVDDACVVFLGKSGAGKSTLATALRNRGYICLGDDLCAIEIREDGVPSAFPAYPQAKLWAETLDRFQLDPTSLRRVRPALEKHALPFQANSSDGPFPIKRLYILTPAKDRQDIHMHQMSGPGIIRALRDHSYRLWFLEGLAKQVSHFQQIARIANSTPVMRVQRPERRFLLDELVDVVEKDFRS